MAKTRTKKIIQVPIEGDLLERIDETAGAVAESRAAFIREACKLRLKTLASREAAPNCFPVSCRGNSGRERIAVLSADRMQQVDEAIRFALDLP